MLQEISDTLPPREEVMHDVPNLDPQDPCFKVDHLELDNSSQQEFGTRDHGDKLYMDEAVFDPIDIELDITIDVANDVKVEVTTNMECKSILNESLEEPIHFLTIAEKLSAEEIDKINSFSFKKDKKIRVTKTSCDIKGRKLKAIIP
ncbi:hypothetical protein PVK06_034007 [Gossypium arboreum]|uniref:Uncharacterized protein n=1 Tax=Gossypium arboreum TaxID=29729 RepID=A0ABR0NCY8_GOSAR|nr:hypothetical protein PVK06_034007 [Gossypium arboreum]